MTTRTDSGTFLPTHGHAGRVCGMQPTRAAWEANRRNLQYNVEMALVRPQEKQAEILAHILDDVVRIPGTSLRFGIDPLLGLIPVIGDVLTVVCGSYIIFTARRLGVTSTDLTRMTYNQVLNGLIGAIPVVGDVYSFGFKSHAKNSALLVRTIKQGEGRACPIVAPSLTLADIGLVSALTVPIALLAGSIGWWLWERNISLISFLF
jgi:hypothetical protein